MTPQSNFMVVAPILPGCVDKLRTLLISMNDRPGMARPDNPIVPFKDFEGLHYARFIILDDPTLGDFEAINQPVPRYPVTLAFLGDCDGGGDDLLAELARRAESGLRTIFFHCQDFTPETDLLQWMRRQSVRPIAAYVNTRGRTVLQVKEEAALRRALLRHLDENPPAAQDPQAIPKDPRPFVDQHENQGNLKLTPP